MGTLIQLGLLAAVALAIAGYFGYRFVSGRITGFLSRAATAAQPPRIRLIRDRGVEWNDRQAVGSRVQALRAAGFRTITIYRIDELEDLKLVALAHPEEGHAAAVYEHGQAGVWSDLVAFYADGSSLTVSSAARGGIRAQPPRHPKVYLEKAPVRRLERAFRKRLRDAPLLAATPESFAGLVEKAYAEELAWRLGQIGGGEPEILERDEELDRRCEPLFAAIAAGHSVRLRQLLATGIEPQGRDARGRTPLIAAAARGDLDLVQALLEAGASVDARAPGEPGEPPGSPGDALARAAERLDDPGARTLLGGLGALAGAGRGKALGVTALTAAIESGNPEVVSVLAAAGADLVGRGGLTALQLAARQGDPEIVQALLAAGAPVDQPGEDGYTPLMSAASEGFVDVVRLLLDADADPEAKAGRDTAITVAAESGYREVVDLLSPLVAAKLQKKAGKLLAEAGEERVDPGARRLLAAAGSGAAPMVEKLLASGLHPDTPAPDGGGDGTMTALMLAAQGGHVDVLRALLAAGADVDRSIDGETALARAASEPIFMDPADQPEAIRTLVAAGASLEPLSEELRSRVAAVMAEKLDA